MPGLLAVLAKLAVVAGATAGVTYWTTRRRYRAAAVEPPPLSATSVTQP
jgi:hypothetical protein